MSDLFQLNITGECGTSTCIDVCPFGQSFFWVRFLCRLVPKALFFLINLIFNLFIRSAVMTERFDFII